MSSPCGEGRDSETSPLPVSRRTRTAPAASAQLSQLLHTCGEAAAGAGTAGSGPARAGRRVRNPPFPGASSRLQVFPRPVPAAVRRDRDGSSGLAGVTGTELPLELRKAAAAALPERGPSAAGPDRALPRRCWPVWFGSPRFQNCQVVVRGSAP